MISGLELIVPPERGGHRLDRFLRDSFPMVPGRSIRSAMERGDVLVAGRKGAKGHPVHAGETVVIRRLAESFDWLPIPGDVPGASILYRDSSVAVIDKPPGVQTEPLGILEPGTMAGYFYWRFPDTVAWNNPPGSPLLSRLDRETSGIILAAMTGAAFRALADQRQAGEISKRYLCRVAGRIQEPAILKWPIDTKGGDRVKVRKDSTDLQPNYWTRIYPVSFDGCRSLVSAEIRKGRRHQIRAHLAASGHPIVGDRIYGGMGECEGRLLLHAAAVTFEHPDSGIRMTVESPAPKDFGV